MFPKGIPFLNDIRNLVNNKGAFPLRIFEWSLVHRAQARIRAGPHTLGKDKEARSANGEGLFLGTSRARPMATSSRGLSKELMSNWTFAQQMP